MELLYRKPTPAYKGTHAKPAQPTGLRAELGAILGGNGAPAYKTSAGAFAQASAPAHGWRQALAVAPSYRTAPRVPAFIDPSVPPPEEGGGPEEPVCVCTSEEGRQVIVL